MGDDWAMPPRGGMFGGDVKGKLQAVLASYLAAQGNPAGALFLRDRMEGKQADRQERQWLAREQWKLQNPGPQQPTQTDRYVQEVLDPKTPPARRQLLQSILVPPYIDPMTGMRTGGMAGGPSPQAPQTLTDDDITRMSGGAGGNASGGFPFSF